MYQHNHNTFEHIAIDLYKQLLHNVQMYIIDVKLQSSKSILLINEKKILIIFD